MATQVLKKNRRRPFFRVILLILLLTPLLMLIAWYLTPKRKLVIAIVDKTVLTTSGQEHISLNWVLNQERFTKNDDQLYDRTGDYYGFFPLGDEKFAVKGLERFNAAQLERLSEDADAAYLTDTYGIYRNEWYKSGDSKERSGIIYGGMSAQDLALLKLMREKHKLIISEFNCLGSPTLPILKTQFENTFGVKWTGWIGRYFDSFDTTINKELPHWLVKNYREQHGGQWAFHKSGIALVHTDDRIVVLENKTHLNKELPHMFATEEGMAHYGMTEKMKYSFWFDIVSPDYKVNSVLSSYFIDANAAGIAELKRNGIPASFPAIIAHVGEDYRFFYFAGDFCDNPVELGSSRFKKIHWLKWFMYNTSDPLERKSFFWELYRPLVTTILEDYYGTLRPAK
ncbi:MAG: hypothetical protein JO301_16275 [Chitinophagaceae bacterium]|nr:hypothetical protein [Chitinophagaceae bacterium]